MENKGSILNQVQGTIHYSDAANHHLQSTLLYTLPNGGSVTNFHSYMLEWLTNSISWYVDRRLYETRTSWVEFHRRLPLLLSTNPSSL